MSLLEGGGVTRKIPKVIECAKRCPTRWSKQATISNINFVCMGSDRGSGGSTIWSFTGYASSCGVRKAQAFEEHLRIMVPNSTSQEFLGYGWTLAKDYATKLNDEIELGRATWQDITLEVKTSTLMSASMENPHPPPKYEPKKLKSDDKKDVCSTYNKCTTENICEYEAANPGKSCLRKHKCSWCRTNKSQSWKHQAWKCRNKAAEGSG